ncbi:unnamed protein product [Heligmosomoides polygyrus]|uniref:Uncharacterized protein n=1 Tax=Heligmosomoides polygyrus TaxID=6339 RepID=A0A183GW98_HELPZ|nr:unnamed protein product [Heligmosomoides polygyrus]
MKSLRSRPPTEHYNVKTRLPDGVTFCAKDAAVPSQTSFEHPLKYRGDTEPLPYEVVAISIQTRNSGRPPQHFRFHYAEALFNFFSNGSALISVNSYWSYNYC